ncbi:MAG: hypothetical protein CL878_14910 [Dehalococcoidia bacterium]|nr:hypothetical protein [Dehalococcoidia bacterium]
MDWDATPYALLLLIVAAAAAALMIAGWRRRPAPGAVPFCGLMLAVAIWSLAYAGELLATDLAAKVQWANAKYIGIAAVPVAWLVFVLQFTGRERWLTRRIWSLLSIEPVLVVLLVWTNDAHNLMRQAVRLDASAAPTILDFSRGPLFWLHVAFAYVLLLIGTVLLFQTALRSRDLFRGQAEALLFGTVAPWLGNALFLLEVAPFSRLDPTPFAFTLTGLAIQWSFLRHGLLDIVPVAHDAVLESMPDGVMVVGSHGRIVDLNPAARRIIGDGIEAVGRSAGEVLADWPDVIHQSPVDDEVYAEVSHADGDELCYYSLRIPPLHDRRGRPAGRLVMLREITQQKQADQSLQQALGQLEQRVQERTANLRTTNERLREEVAERERAEETVNFMAYHDPLTKLPNRALFNDRLGMALTQARRNGEMLAVMLLDLDRFKTINDTLGHPVGDKLLQVVGERLAGCLREGDTIARLGGDEFLLLLTSMAHTEDAAKVGRRIFNSLEQTVRFDDQELYIAASIGVSVYPTDGEDTETLLKNADAAMYRAKEHRGNNYQFYTPAMNATALELLSLETDLRRAVEREELVVYYQPQLDLATGRVTGAEALVRWRHPKQGLVAPFKFIPLAEETGLIAPIGEWVLRTAAAQSKAWQDAHLAPIRVAVNLSALQFRDKSLMQRVALMLDTGGLDPGHLELEMTESAVMEDMETTITILHDLKKLGLHISVDDFGTGYSSLAYLKRLPIDMLKIDRSFVRDLEEDREDEAIVTAIIAMAHNLGMEVIAEGVETEGQLAFLRSQQCDMMQGYLFSPPVPTEEMTTLLREGHGIAPSRQPPVLSSRLSA